MILSNIQIDNLCKSIVERTEKNDLYSFMNFETLYNTGLRINELIDYSRLNLVDTNSILVQTQKFSNPRLIDIVYFNGTYFSNFITGNLKNFIRSYSYYCDKLITYNFEYSKLFVLDKHITTHIFRHNYVKKLYASGFTITEISAIIGERENKNTEGYINSIISTD